MNEHKPMYWYLITAVMFTERDGKQDISFTQSIRAVATNKITALGLVNITKSIVEEFMKAMPEEVQKITKLTGCNLLGISPLGLFTEKEFNNLPTGEENANNEQEQPPKAN